MALKKTALLKTLFFIFLISTFCSSSDLTVTKDGSGKYTTIQAAVNAAVSGDRIVILDSGIYEERVIIDSIKSNITLTSQSASKPTISWKDTLHIHPTSSQEATQKIIDFHNNGALLIYKAFDITIENIKIDGVSPFAFGANSIWNGKDPMQHGNSAITVKSSGNVVIRNCDICNAYFGIYLKDDNNGGIYTNANSGDSDPWNFKGFGRNGNHLIEKNRIHNNSYGIFCESMWDLGSTIRYNLIYENHHYSNEFAEKVENLTSDGTNQPGGAFFFKDHLLSPLAIYNNTLWHNRLSFVGHWKSGSQHLLFNNIIAQPDSLYNSYQSLDPSFSHRMHHSLYAAQSQKIGTQSMIYSFIDPDRGIDTFITVSKFILPYVMGNMGKLEEEGFSVSAKIQSSSGLIDTTIFVDKAIRPGARILEPFKNSTIGWFEMKFISTDISSPDFLTPDWNDPDVARLVLDQGWSSAGICDADGSIADIGAISKSGSPQDLIRTYPLTPAIIDGTKAVLNFKITSNSSITSPKIKYLRLIKNIPYGEDSMGPDTPISESDVVEFSVTDNIKSGVNSVTLDLGTTSLTGNYAFFEMIIEATNSSGKTVGSVPCFIPYRKTANKFEVTVLDKSGTSKITSLKTGDTVQIRINAVSTSGNSPFKSVINPASVTLSSGAAILNIDKSELKIDSIVETITFPVIFTKVPDEGIEFINVSGLFSDEPSTGIPQNLIVGTSEKITVKSDNSSVFDHKKPKSSPYHKPGIFFTIYNANGRMIYRGSANTFNQINSQIQSLKSGKGIYFVQSRSADGLIIDTRRISKF